MNILDEPATAGKIALLLAYKYPHARQTIAHARNMAEERRAQPAPAGSAPAIYIVSSATTAEVYNIESGLINLVDKKSAPALVPGLTCDCPAFRYRPAVLNRRPYCKHILAAILDYNRRKAQEQEEEIYDLLTV